MDSQSQVRYETRRGQLQQYFDITALDNWKQLTSNTPVSRIRQTVRDGRDAMRKVLLEGLPEDLSGSRLLDAGCGTGALAMAAAERGAAVTAIDLSANLIDLAATRAAEIGRQTSVSGSVTFNSGDMLADSWGEFDHTVCMDSLIHYEMEDTLGALARLASRSRKSLQFTVAPANRLLLAMHRVGQWLPRQSRSPDIQPLPIDKLEQSLVRLFGPYGWQIDYSHRVSSGFYKSHAFRLVKA